jgi:hypothetical protein
MQTSDKITIRSANSSDISFLIHCIIEADKSGTSKSAYCAMMDIDRDTFTEMMKRIFIHDLDGCEFAASSFCVLEYNNRLIGGSASWIEAIDGVASWQTRMLSIRAEADENNYHYLLSKKDIVSNLVPERTPYALQIESVYIDINFRGKGLFKKMLNYHVTNGLLAYPSLKKMEILVYDNNQSALNSYLKAGFNIYKQTKVENNTLENIFPSNGMILLSKSITNGY